MGFIDSDVLEARVVGAARALDPDVEVLHIDPEHAQTVDFCAYYGYPMAESGNCILVRSKSGALRYAACLVQATRRLDLNRHSRMLVQARKASFASAGETLDCTGMIPGGVTPIGLPPALPIVVDEPIMQLERIIVGGGGRSIKLRLRPQALLRIDALLVAEISRLPNPEAGG